MKRCIPARFLPQMPALIRPPEIVPLSQQPQLAHGLATEGPPALNETQLAPPHPPNAPLGVRLVQFVVRGRAVLWGE